MMADHTPVPWSVGGKDHHGRRMIIAQQGPITVCPAAAHGIGEARFIIRAVNSYGAMLAALKKVIDCQTHIPDVIAAATAAIALAEKED